MYVLDNSLIVLNQPPRDNPSVFSLNLDTGKLNWRARCVLGSERGDCRLRLVGATVHVSYVSFGVGFFVQVFDGKTGDTLFTHKRTTEEYHHSGASKDRCTLS